MATKIYRAATDSNLLLVFTFAVLKLLIHLFTFDNYELHRDAYLYYALSENLDWGFVAVPPSIALVGKIATTIFGTTTFALRFFPALIGALSLIVIGLMVRELGGKKAAITLASLAFIFSPSFLHVNALFQPVSFNQYYWLLSGYLILIMIKRDNPKIWIWIGIVFGLAFLNKYSIVFFIVAFGLALLFTEHRKFFFSRYFLFAVLIGLILISPNILWQIRHNWPVMHHMVELRESQLIHVSVSGFLINQFLMNIQGLYIWLTGLVAILISRKEGQFRLFGLIYLLVIILLLFGSGKSYYSLGVYPILFVFGAYIIEKYVTRYFKLVFSFLIISVLFSFYISLSFDGIPFYTFEDVASKDAFRWEDGKMYDVPQDMSDMTGWKEIGQTVSQIFISLPDSQKANCAIYCYHYGQAGAIMFYGKQHHVPQPISFNDSFVFWLPDSLTQKTIIWVHFDDGNGFDGENGLPKMFDLVELKATIENPYFRENGTQIFLCYYPKKDYKNDFRARVRQRKMVYE